LYINSRASRQGASGGPANNSRKQYALGQCRDNALSIKLCKRVIRIFRVIKVVKVIKVLTRGYCRYR
jgi:hypothetical protein